MRLSACLLILAACMWAQSDTETAKAAVERAQTVTVSSLDSRLPKVSLKFFLEYEAAGSPITWGICQAGDKKNPGDKSGTSICVEAGFDLNDRVSVSVLISVGGAGSSATPKLIRATVTDMSAQPHTVHRLGDLPMEMHRAKPRLPQEPPIALGLLWIQQNAG
jgi:hypothetical protein